MPSVSQKELVRFIDSVQLAAGLQLIRMVDKSFAVLNFLVV